MAAWMLSVQEEKWVCIHNFIKIIYQCSHFLYSYSNYLFLFSCSIPLFSFLHFPLLPWVFIFQILLFDSLIFDCLFIFFVRYLLLIPLFIPYSQIPFSLYAFRTYSFPPPCSRQSSTFSCAFFMILYFTFLTPKTSSSVRYHHLLRHHLFLDLFSVFPSLILRPRCVNSQLVSLTPVGILFYLQYLVII